MVCLRNAVQWLCLPALAWGCTSPHKDVFRAESFDPGSPFERHFVVAPAATCQAAQRALLSQGYLVTTFQDDRVTALKSFQPKPDEHMTIDFTVSCIGDVDGHSVAYANAVQTRYELRTSPNAYGLSAPVIGVLSVPFGSRADNLVKTGAETISDYDFYDRFWNLMMLHAEPQIEDPGD